ncbi:EI24 domain-containing protein [Erythrobacteraceae bacterium E2-1 Yellow Sea]|nr:EI24 domain-containing protein [Erythrobacteraceae bacterium E2-1 Yellow Sea]
MMTLPRALALSLRQLADPALLRIMIKSVGITLVLFIAGGIALWRGLESLISNYLTSDYGAELGGLAALALTLLGGWLLFRVIALAVLQFFADEVVLAVERAYYPEASEQARTLPFREDLANSSRGAGRALAFNILAAPLALVLLFTAIGPAVVFFTVNAILLGRELTDMAWLRHKKSPEMQSPARAAERVMLGAAVTGLLMVPLVGLLAPVIGAAAGTHLVQARLRKAEV